MSTVICLCPYQAVDLCERLENILERGIAAPARLMPYMSPSIRELLAEDKQELVEKAKDSVVKLLVGWLDTWIAPEELVVITDFYNTEFYRAGFDSETAGVESDGFQSATEYEDTTSDDSDIL